MMGPPVAQWLGQPMIVAELNRAKNEHASESHKSAACLPPVLVQKLVDYMAPASGGRPPNMPPPPPPGEGRPCSPLSDLASTLLAAVMAARFVLGLRPGETGESTGNHQVLACDVFLGRHPELGLFVDVVLGHCKTANVAWRVAGAGVTKSGVRLYDALAKYAALAGHVTTHSAVESHAALTFDSYAVRVSLTHHTDHQVAAAFRLLPDGHGGGWTF
jgi:hypothetical protein